MPVFNRYFGVKPGPDAPKLDRLLWFRGYYLKNFPLYVVLLPFLLLAFPQPLGVIILAASFAPWLLGFIRLNVEIRRER